MLYLFNKIEESFLCITLAFKRKYKKDLAGKPARSILVIITFFLTC